MARIARLMSGLPEFIEPEYLAATGANIRGELRLRGMGRLRELLHSDAGRVAFRLDFARKNGLSCISGEFKAELELLCQRCLQPFASELCNAIRTGIAAQEGQIAQLEQGFEPLVVAEKTLRLAEFLEDEILLSMPLAAAHAPERCPGQAWPNDRQAERDSPFALLKDLKIKHS